ncbi:transcriptional regulator, TetR family [Lentzea xinjiangensis]|uniref:Transcriptional regulator, TetR family n=1 Tax=Lentzea xinjiangensis TaxID=402600 RepID=A0A1H9NCL2_9PSEU|nr:TetR/AcrR family transcriptional regulator [Lentzea xinjiangensis]SER33686.1 transcriptional regulator, TetR family [Lentzea xinjiangensis]
MRADARRNLERIRAAASEAFAEHGLDAPLEDIARRAGVSAGTIYHRFGSREGLMDAAVSDIAARKLDAAIAATTGTTPWERFESYVSALGEVQAADPAFNDVVALRYPHAGELRSVHERAIAQAETLMRAAQADGSLRPDADPSDIGRLIWLNAQAIRLGGDWWRRGLGFFLDGLSRTRHDQ